MDFKRIEIGSGGGLMILRVFVLLIYGVVDEHTHQTLIFTRNERKYL